MVNISKPLIELNECIQRVVVYTYSNHDMHTLNGGWDMNIASFGFQDE